MSAGLTVTLSVEHLDTLKGALGSVRRRIVPTMIRTARRGVWRYVVDPVKNMVATESGIGSAIWGKDQSGLTSQGLVVQGKLNIGSHAGTTTLKLRGIPALLERGGPIKAHTIKNAFGHSGRKMPHPGMTLRAHGFGQRGLDEGEAAIFSDVDGAIGEMLRRHGF